MESSDITKKIKELQAKIDKESIDGASPKQLAKYLVEVDKLKALMLATYKNKNNYKER